jgi:putative Mn2+ efflux pump MntP
MNTPLLFLLAFGLAMDAFAVSVTNGIGCRMPVWKNALYSGLAFGIFQAGMPLIGYIAGNTFSAVIAQVDHWIALLLLSLIGGKMIVEATGRRKNPENHPPQVFRPQTLLLQAVATSIDALAVGVGLGVMQVNIVAAMWRIGVVTFLCSFTGVVFGKLFGGLLREKAELVGGIILVLIGFQIFAEHTFF